MAVLEVAFTNNEWWRMRKGCCNQYAFGIYIRRCTVRVDVLIPRGMVKHKAFKKQQQEFRSYFSVSQSEVEVKYQNQRNSQSPYWDLPIRKKKKKNLTSADRVFDGVYSSKLLFTDLERICNDHINCCQGHARANSDVPWVWHFSVAFLHHFNVCILHEIQKKTWGKTHEKKKKKKTRTGG